VTSARRAGAPARRAALRIADFHPWSRWQGDDIDPSQSFELTNVVEGWGVRRLAARGHHELAPIFFFGGVGALLWAA
jgi:hypothetical protein